MSNSAKAKKVWVCQTWKDDPGGYSEKHIFSSSGDGFCHKTEKNHGLLMLEEIPPELSVSIIEPGDKQEFEEGNNISLAAEVFPETDVKRVDFFVDDNKVGESGSLPFNFFYTATRGSHTIYAKVTNNQDETSDSAKVNILVTAPTVPKVGLAVILMDASDSMTGPAYSGSTVTKMRLAAITAAQGIFDLERMQNNPNALVALYKFDDRVKLMLVDTIANLISRFKRDVTAFSDYLYDELMEMLQNTDINQALIQAHGFVSRFLKKELTEFPLKNYDPMMQRVFKYQSAESVSIANVRVLMYTDGKQFGTPGGEIINPFVQHPIKGLNHDIVIGAFFGKETDDGCKQLKDLLSRCPIHDEPQFFLFDNPAKIGNLKKLFRMASGASGFCPKCMEK